jgi:predicted transcriptional regulator
VFADEIRRAIEAATRLTLPQVTALLWRAYGEGKVTEAEAESLSGLIEARSLTNDGSRLRQTSNSRETADRPVVVASQKLVSASRRGVGSRPRTDGSLERRRRWAASGRLPPGLAARFTLAEQAVLALVAAEAVRRKDCRLAVGHLAAIVGVAETTVRNAIREASRLGLVTVEERRVTGFRNDTNIVRIVSPEWVAWLRLARRAPVSGSRSSLAAEQTGGGCKSAQGTPTEVPDSGKPGTTAPSQCCRGAAGDLDRSALSRIRAGGRTG